MLSVIIPALNSAETIRLTLSSIFSNDFPQNRFEVLVIDNGSVDGTVEVAKKYPVKIYHCMKRGIGPPRNLGLKVAMGDIVCFTDSDCIIEKDWLKKICRFFEANREVDGVGGPVRPYMRGANKVQRNAGEIFVEDQNFPIKKARVQFGVFRGVLLGTNSAYRKSALVSVGGYEEPGGSSPELSWRLVSNGSVLYFDPNIKVYHIFPWRLVALYKQQFRWGTRMTQLRIKHGLYRFKEMVLIFYFLARCALFLFSFQHHSKKLLRLTQLVMFSLGRIKGIRSIV